SAVPRTTLHVGMGQDHGRQFLLVSHGGKVRARLADLLRGAGHGVQLAGVRDAAQCISAMPVDLVVMCGSDLSTELPALTERIRATAPGPYLPIVQVTEREDDARTSVRERGLDDLIVESL